MNFRPRMLVFFVLQISLCSSAVQAMDTVALLQQHCVDCHQGEKPPGGFDFSSYKSSAELLSQPALLLDVVNAIDTSLMPPLETSELSEQDRHAATQQARKLLHQAVLAGPPTQPTPIRRMTRFQYSNAVKDLLQLRIAVFSLPEQLAREYGNYYKPASKTMPSSLKVGNRALGKSQLIEPRLVGVTPYPQDLRAEHGFDNQADQLSLSPLLLEQFMELSQSVVNAANFDAKSVGVWPELFALPADVAPADLRPLIAERLRKFLTRAYRQPSNTSTVNRFTNYALGLIGDGADYTSAMKATVAGILASPRFFYIHQQADAQFTLASRLSFFLWGSIPDQPLLDSAARGELLDRSILAAHVDRMLLDVKSKRFCDSFPAQWLQLENIISSQPDPGKFPQFYFARYNASMHMVLEPLLLFETVLIEDKSILQFIHSDFSYRSITLKTWYDDADTVKHTGPGAITFDRVPITDMRQGGVITNAAIMTMTSAPDHTKPITRGAWFAHAILHAPPKPPPADVPPIDRNDKGQLESFTIREQLAMHRDKASCAGCHKKLDPLGFALENFDPVGKWRETYENGKTIDASGTLYSKYDFHNIVELKQALLQEQDRFAYAFTQHLLSFALGRKTTYQDTINIENIVAKAADDDYKLKTIITQLVLSEAFSPAEGLSADKQASIKEKRE
jgi:hypothetical protein